MGREEPDERDNVVATVTDSDADKYALLERALDLSRFWETLERVLERSGKDRSRFRIAVKPNLAMMLRRSDVGTYTDPFLVIHLLRLLVKRGFKSLCVVESQNLYGNWFENRSVSRIAKRAGYGDGSEIEVRGGGTDERVPVIDLTHDSVPVDLGPGIGEVEVGRAWVEADFRINFAKMKSHFYSRYSLAIKNVYGCLPLQDKVRGYHCKRVVGEWTAALLKKFPVHFSIVDGYTAADGWLGVKIKAICTKPCLMIAGADVMAVDAAGAALMGLDPGESVMYQALGAPGPYHVIGNAKPLKGWRNAPRFLSTFSLLIESSANVMDFAGSLSTGGHDDCFPHSKANKGALKRLLYWLTAPVNLAMDLGALRLRIREKRFGNRLKKLRGLAPVTAGSDFFIQRLAFLCGDDLALLAGLLTQGAINDLSFSGHHLFLNGREIELKSRLTTGALAIIEILEHVRENGIDPAALGRELAHVSDACPEFFGEGRPWPYCYE